MFEIAPSASLDETDRDRLTRRFGARVTAVSQDARSQARNRELALERVAEKVASALRVPKKRRPTRPTRASRERRIEAKRHRSRLKRTRRRPASED